MISNIFSFSLRGNQVKEGTPNRGVKKRRNSLFYFWTSLPFCIISYTRKLAKRALFKNIKFTHLSELLFRKSKPHSRRFVYSTNSTKCSSKESATFNPAKFLKYQRSKTTYQIEALHIATLGFSQCIYQLLNLDLSICASWVCELVYLCREKCWCSLSSSFPLCEYARWATPEACPDLW